MIGSSGDVGMEILSRNGPPHGISGAPCRADAPDRGAAGMWEGFSALVVDDDSLCRRTATRILRRLGAGSVDEADDGDQALICAAARGRPLDMIICDLKMPRMDGIETIRGLAAANRTALIVLASSADARVMRSVRDMAAKFGLRSLRTVEKPVTPQKLREIIEAHRAMPALAATSAGIAAPVMLDAADIRRGLAADEFAAYFQPKVDLATMRVTGAEALVRWIHPVHGVLPPGAFLEDVQEAGLLGELTTAMFSKAAWQCAAWRRSGLDMSVSVNLPVACLGSRDLPPRLEALSARYGLCPEHVILEVTEDGWLKHEAIAREVLTRLRLRGFGLSIDDYGTGYSTAQQLLQAPFNEMKIDQSFVRSALSDKESACVLFSSIALARSLDLKVVAEGAETAGHWEMLTRAGCDLVQGFFVARPMPGDILADWVVGWDRRAATGS